MADVISSTDNYLNLLFSLPNVPPLTVLAIFFLCMARILPILIWAPFLGGRNLPAIIKIAFSIAIIAIVLPQVLLTQTKNIDFSYYFAIFALKELFVGTVMGFIVAIPFYMAQSSGSLIDHMRGSSSLQVTDPTNQSQTASMGIMYNLVLISVYFMINGPILFINGLVDSFTILPIDQLFSSHFFHTGVPFWQVMIALLNKVLTIAVQLAAPSLVGIIMAEMFLGIANRMAPQVQIVFLGIPLKSWTGLALLAISWIFILNQLGKNSLMWTNAVDQTIYQISEFNRVASKV